MQDYEEKHEISPMWSWAIVAALCLLIIAWGTVNCALIKDRPREWNFDTLPDAPSQSIYSTEQPPEKAAPPEQVAPLPEPEPEGRPPK